MRAFVEGEEVRTAESGAMLRYLGHSQSRGVRLAVHQSSGELFDADSLVKMGEQVLNIPDMPVSMPGSDEWKEWAEACSKAAVPPLDLVERLPGAGEDEAEAL
jgi:hypothetical protein